MAKAKGNRRNISIRFAIEGEKELNAQIGRLNAEFKRLETSLKLSKAEFAGQLNTEKALTAQMNVLKQQYQNTANAISVYENKQKAIKAAIKAAEEEVSKLNASLDAAPDQDTYDKTVAKIKLIERAIEELYRKLANTEAQTDKAKIRQGEINTLLQKVIGYLNEARNSFDKTAKSIDGYGNEIGKADQAMEDMAELEKLEIVNAKIEQLRDMLNECVEAAQAFDLSIKGVEKTVDGIDGEALRQMILDMSAEMPIDANTLAQIAQGGGQYGISTEGLEEYIRTIANLTVSTDITADTGAQNLARFVGLMQESEDNFENIGSVITALGNTTKTTESQILDMATGIASAGHLAGMSAGEVLALSAALSSAGVESQAGSSAMSTFIINIANAVAEGGDAVQSFADLTGKTAQEFRTAWENDALGTIVSIVDGLSEIEKTGGNVFGILSDIGVSEIRMRRAILGLATSEGTLEQSLLTANTAWDENIALMAEASKYYEADANKKQIMINQFERLKISVGDAAAPALERFYELLGKGAEGFAKLNEEAPGFVQVLTALTVGLAAFTGLAVGIVSLTKAFAALKTAITAVNAATGLTTLTLGGWVSVAAGVIATLGVLIASFGDFNDELDGTTEAVRKFREEQDKNDTTLESNAEYISIQIDRLKELEEEYGTVAGKMDAYRSIVESIRDTAPELNLEIDEQTGLLKENTEAIKENIDAWVDAERKRYQQEQSKGILEEIFKAEEEYRNARNELATALDVEYSSASARNTWVGKQLADFEAAKRELEALLALLDEYGIEYTPDIKAPTGAESPVTQMAEEMKKAAEYDFQRAMDILLTSTSGAESPVSQMARDIQTYAGATDPWIQRIEELSAVTDEETAAVREAFAEAFGNVREEMEKTFSVFDRFDEKSGMSLKEFKRNMEDNIEAMQGYRDNLQKVFENDQLSDGFKTWIANQDPEAVYELLEDLAGGTDKQLAEIQGLWDSYNSSLDETSGEVATKSGEVADIVLEGMKDANKSAEAYVSGSMTVQGLISGLNSQKKALEEKAKEISDIFISVYRTTTDQHSPARVFRKMAQNDIKGLILGHEDMRSELERSSERLAAATLSSFNLATARMSANLSFNSFYNAKDYTSILKRMLREMQNGSAGITGTGSAKLPASAKNNYERQLMTRLLY